MIYDYIIIGAGISGCVCSYLLQKNGYKCLILEKNKNICEKVCGGGISYKAIRLLREIGMPVSELFGMDVSAVNGHIINFKTNRIIKIYD